MVDDTYFQYAYSDVVRAIDYGYAKGARIFSMSFGQDARTSATVSRHGFEDMGVLLLKTLGKVGP